MWKHMPMLTGTVSAILQVRTCLCQISIPLSRDAKLHLMNLTAVPEARDGCVQEKAMSSSWPCLHRGLTCDAVGILL